jgi:chemotaxis protein methyltransferase CheR
MKGRGASPGAGVVSCGLGEAPPLSDRDLRAIAQLVYEKAGITLHDGKRALVTARLQKRLRVVGVRSFSDYLRHLETDPSGDELVAFLDAIATNHTSFFREPQHFDLLGTRVVPEWMDGSRQAGFEIWCAACSTGEEPFTLAMTLKACLPDAEWSRATILASDLSTKALRVAQGGIYTLDRVQGLPIDVRRRYFERGLGPQEGLARVKAEIRRPVVFRQINLIEVGDLGRRFPAIFCRNVLIYFDRAVQQRVVAALERHLAPGGYLFISHSESLNGITHGLRWIAPAVYRRGDP